MANARITWGSRNGGPSQEDGFRVYRSSVPISGDALPVPIATLGGGARAYDDLDDLSGMIYYAIGAFNGDFERVATRSPLSFGELTPVVVIPPLDLSFISATVAPAAAYSASCDTGTANGNRRLLLVVSGQSLYNGGEVPYIASFAGQNVRNQSAGPVGNVDHVFCGFVNVEGGGNKTLTVRSVSGTPYRWIACIYEVQEADESDYAFESLLDSEAAYSIATYEGGAAVAVGIAENASLAGVSMSGLSTVDRSPVFLQGGRNFWSSTISEDGLSAGTKSLQLDCDGATSRAATAGISMKRIADPVSDVSLVYVGTTSEGDGTLSIDIDTGAAEGDKTYLIGLGGQSNGIPYSHTFDGVSCESLYSYKPSSYDFVQFLTCVVASGGVKTFSFANSGTFYRKAMSVWEVHNWRRQDDFVIANSTEATFTMTPKDGYAIAAISLGRGSTAGAGIVGLTSDYGPAITGSNFYYSASSDEYPIGAAQTINNDVNGTETTRDIILALMLGPE